MSDNVILVDQRDTPIGMMGKLEAHTSGRLHRAFSIFVFNSNGELLMQRRAMHKYHSGGLWTNTCCSHPRPSEQTHLAARRRLMEEMGFECSLREIHAFVYRVVFDNGLIEHEYDHVLIGESDAIPRPNPDEVMEWRWIGIPELRASIAARPQDYTYWLKFALEDILKKAGRA